MTAEASNPIAVRRHRPETGWARARRLRGRGIRTCMRATLDNDPGQARQEDDWNVVRGED
ncbi:hypothetical protein [Streptomyces sp. NPDC001833]|uniref:hypothetical protein n=1 Tax=Streptomyces sp. NPDC001833 TaxID=3154658 RepID=UPI00332BE020